MLYECAHNKIGKKEYNSKEREKHCNVFILPAKNVFGGDDVNIFYLYILHRIFYDNNICL